MDVRQCLQLLANWCNWAEQYWYDLPGQTGLGLFGTGYNAWGVQTNQKYISAAATIATHPDAADLVDQELMLNRALTALRYALASHQAGPAEITCTDGSTWGNTWISALGLERMMHVMPLLAPHMSEADHAAFHAMLASEADWLMTDYRRGGHAGLSAGVWASSGCNDPESNIWNGALLWRAATAMPDHPNADAWREWAHRFLVNGVTVYEDEANDTIVAGKPLRERFVGANFFPNYALDHHGYLNVGYMVICVSNAAMLHFDLRTLGAEAPESLHRRQAELWGALRRFIFSDGRLARIGGDSRARYCYCQEYLLPSLLYAADHLGDEHAFTLASRQVELIAAEAATNFDGSFYGKRLPWIAEESPYYYTRLESDRAAALSMALAYAPLVAAPQTEHDTASLEASLAGAWCEPEHGAVVHRTPERFASFAWRAHGYAQGLCQPGDDGDLAEWECNLGAVVRCQSDTKDYPGGQDPHRQLIEGHVELIDGGFIACGATMEGVSLEIREGANRVTDAAVTHQAVAALPDGRTMLGLQWCHTREKRLYCHEFRALNLNVPNDVHVGCERTLETAGGPMVLKSPPEADELIDLRSQWVNVAGRVGVVGLTGAESLTVRRRRARQGGPQKSLFVEQICWSAMQGMTSYGPVSTLFDVGWAVLSSATPGETAAFQAANAEAAIDFPDQPTLRGVRVTGMDGKSYAFIANFGEAAVTTTVDGQSVTLDPHRAAVVGG